MANEVSKDSAGNENVIRYFADPKETIAGYLVKGVVLNEDGREVTNPFTKWISCKTKREARHLTTVLNNELRRFGRYVSVSEASPVIAGDYR